MIKSIRRTANIGLYGSMIIVLATIVFHFLPFHISFQSPLVTRWMLISGTVLAVLAIVTILMTIRKTTPRIRQLGDIESKLKAYKTYISNIYGSTLAIVFIECVMMVLMTETVLLMVVILLVLLLFLSYPNMYKMRTELGLTDTEMIELFGSDFIADTPKNMPQPDLDHTSQSILNHTDDSPSE